MPWSNNSGGGGWKSGGGGNNGGGPWGQGPSGGGGGQPPDLEEILKRSQDRLKQVMPSGGGLSTLAILLLVAAAILAWGVSGFYTVRTNEVALNLVFGKYVGRTGEGLNYNWPYPVGSVVKLPVTDIRSIEIGNSPIDARRAGNSLQTTDSLMLTADENIVDIVFSVQWRINAQKPQDYVFNIQNPDGSIKAVAESAMREVVGRRQLKNVLPSEVPPATVPTPDPNAPAGTPAPAPGATPAPDAVAAVVAQNEILDEVRKAIQQTLDQYGAGIVIERVIITRIGPPADVLAAFTDVQAAVQERDRLQNEALTHASSVVPRARGQAKQIEIEADAYRQRLTAEAQGAASRFRQVYEEYKKAPEVTRERMYLETMERILAGTDKIVIDKNQSGSGVVPYLPLGELQRRPAAQPK